MISAKDARQQVVNAKAAYDELQKQKAEKAINKAIAANEFSCTLDFIPTDNTMNWLRSLGYEVRIQNGRFNERDTIVSW